MPLSASTRTHALRAGTLVAAAGIALTCAPEAFAIPGDSGDLTIVEIRNAGRDTRGNGGPICQFRLSANNFETLQAVPWTITELPLTVPPGNVLAGTLPLSQGRARSPLYQLPDGTYQLQWVVPGSLTKQRTFVVNCPDESRGARGGERNDGSGRPSSGNQASGNEASGNASTDGAGADATSSDTKAAPGDRPSGGVPAGGGGAATLQAAGYDGGSGMNTGTTLGVGAGVAGLAGLVLARRAARRRARGEA
ncbi:hypothetical protein OG233_03935 [Streptomyces sp. NBC_01218]|uniref:hypothetical protein n=1 Tax=unclassified Streptomyces TaxID=2593676 RepID=UPI0023B96FE6|nr:MULTISPECIES: hypothetical protein [unclassified Streptomyces]WEH38732.1 hypothetical protein PZB77_03975 [Streptomyces sp. AM 2-1-1]WSQ50392.1 hypothetical protein OG233_03935 [Streptomyces sp. NBC_01218]